VIPIALKGLDIVAASKSGTGKTAAYILPILDKLNKTINIKNRVLRGLILVPTRELADQVSKSISLYGEFLKIKHTKIQGGISKSLQLEKLDTGIDLIVATPGRLKSFIEDDKIDISSINTIVLDEADTMLKEDMGFINTVEFLLSQCSYKRQIMMFSATISQNIKKLAKEFLQNPVTVEVSNRRDTVSLIDHKAYKIDQRDKIKLIRKIIVSNEYKQILIFVNTKQSANELYEILKDLNIKVIHGDIEYQERSKSIKNFKNGSLQALIATDIAGRGIDIKSLPCVINYELPEKTDDFTHRVGRTGRANNRGEVVSILTTLDYNHFTKIERDLRLNIKREVYGGFELKDRQPRQKQMKRKSLSQKKGKKEKKPAPKTGAKSKKTTKRDPNRNFRR